MNEPNTATPSKLETQVQAEVRLAYAAKGGVKLWRNNSGAFKDATGRVVRYGLGNESPAISKVLKSADLIGWRTVTITPDMIGQQVAVFLSIECKREGWKPSDTDERETAQRRWANEVNRAGGEARFISDADEV